MAEKNPLCLYSGVSKELQSGDTLPGGTGSGDSVKKTYTQTSHGFAAGDAIYRKADSTWAKGKADVIATAECEGIVESVNGNDFVLVEFGEITGLSGGTDGSAFFLSKDTAGATTTTEPDITAYVSKCLGKWTGTSTAIVNIARGVLVDPGGTAYTDEMAMDAIAAAFAAGTQTGIAITYNDTLNKFSFDVQALGDVRYVQQVGALGLIEAIAQSNFLP